MGWYLTISYNSNKRRKPDYGIDPMALDAFVSTVAIVGGLFCSNFRDISNDAPMMGVGMGCAVASLVGGGTGLLLGADIRNKGKRVDNLLGYAAMQILGLATNAVIGGGAAYGSVALAAHFFPKDALKQEQEISLKEAETPNSRYAKNMQDALAVGAWERLNFPTSQVNQYKL